MKLDDVLVEAISREHDEMRIHDVLIDAWDSDYKHFTEELSGFIDDLPLRYPNNKKILQIHQVFKQLMNEYKECKVSDHDFDNLSKHEDSIYYNADKLKSLEGTIKALYRYKMAVEKLEKSHLIFCSPHEIEDAEYSRGTFEYGKPFDPYDEYGVSRKDF